MEPPKIDMATILEPGKEAAANGSLHEQSGARTRGAHLIPSQAASRASFWRRSAPKRLRAGGLSATAVWDAYWRRRKSSFPFARFCRKGGSPLAWGWDFSNLATETAPLFDIADEIYRGASAAKYSRPKRRERLRDAVGQWLEIARDGNTDGAFSLACLAAAHVLDALGRQLDADQGWNLVDFLFATAEQAQPWRASAESSAETAVAQQMLAGELPLTLAALFHDMAPMFALRRAARRRLSEGFAELLDGKGLVRSPQLAAMRPLTACWTRCAALGRKFKRGAWIQAADKQYQAHVRQAIRWSDGAGRPLLAGHDALAWTVDFLAAAVRLSGPKDAAAAARSIFTSTSLAKALPATKRTPPAPSYHSEWSALGVMRSEWSPRANVVAVDYSSADMQLEVISRGRPMLTGAWTAESRLNGAPLTPAGPWEQVCWFTDPDVDFLEFCLEYEGGTRLERQILLGRQDEFLLIVDHLKHDATAALEHAYRLAAASGLAWRGEEETRDAVLVANKPAARLLPAALPEWRIDPRIGELLFVDGCVRLEERMTCRALACPLFIDLNPRRVRKPCTWRQLTIAESLRVAPPDAAVGYRIQCGADQWLYYRSQGPRGNRTLLGQNTSSEFLAARFVAKTGEIQELVQIE
jgi:hypothetical protein